jgi:hypothetical protein
MKDLLNNISANTNVTSTIDDGELGELRQRFCNATKLDRSRVKKMLNALMIEIREATNNETHIGTRVSRDVVTFLNDASSQHATSVSALIRDAVVFYIKHELSKRVAPQHADEDRYKWINKDYRYENSEQLCQCAQVAPAHPKRCLNHIKSRTQRIA